MIYTYKNKKEFEEFFRREVMPIIRSQEAQYMEGMDIPLRREEWNNMIDSYVTDEMFPKRALDWSCPW